MAGEWVDGNQALHYGRGHCDGDARLWWRRAPGNGDHAQRSPGFGSVRLIADAAAAIVHSSGFDAFGLRRVEADYATLSPLDLVNFDTSVTNRGYTGHETIDELGLIHMNGRVYGPVIGRFLSADPFIQAPENSQSHNRYSYVLNNPMSYTDPSGNFFSLIAGAVAAFKTFTAVQTFAIAFAAGTADGLIRGASFGDALKSGLIAGASAGAFVGLGNAFKGAQGFWGVSWQAGGVWCCRGCH